MDTLESLVREVITESPVNRCADDGTTCVFCNSHYDYMAGFCGKPIVIHSPDCWLKRAEKVLSELKKD